MSITLEYLNLPIPGVAGRGGVVRFFMLAHKIPFDEKVIEMAAWPERKKVLLEEGIGYVPVLHIDGKMYSEHIPLMRLAAVTAKVEVPTDAKEIFAQDAIATVYNSFRDAWVKAAFGGDEAVKKEFVASMPERLAIWDKLIAKYATGGEPFLCGAKPWWGDAATFGMMNDAMKSGMLEGPDALKPYPKLLSIYNGFMAIKEVADWFPSK